MNQGVKLYPISCKCGYDYEGYQTEPLEATHWQNGPIPVVTMFSPKEGFQVSETLKLYDELIFTCPKCMLESIVKI